ncbi:MAG: hypothetical protein GX601_14415, partial [Anaerolineales bacterium]|nr:hypothetical protein [Anaerolineales bacterium]
AVYRRDDFAVGSLPAPEEAEFDELVGAADTFAYVDCEGGRHVFSRQVETALGELALADGIAVLDEGHPRDLVARVQQALDLMLGHAAAQDLIAELPYGDLRRYLQSSFWTGHHYKLYHKRPVYWPLQSASKSYGVVLFHERVDHDTLYSVQRDFLEPKQNQVAQQLRDLQGRRERLSGGEARELEREMQALRDFQAELDAFDTAIGRALTSGYEPEPNWIDDGVILRLAPLHELIPTLASEALKYWERLEAGEYDWSHIAGHYWPERVREACRTQKSYAIAHGHLEWYEGEQ